MGEDHRAGLPVSQSPRPQPHAQLRPAQCASRRHSRGAWRLDRHDRRRPAALARGHPPAPCGTRSRRGRGVRHAREDAALAVPQRGVVDHEDRAAEDDGQLDGAEGLRVPRVPHAFATGLRLVSEPLCVDRRPAVLGHDPFHVRCGRAPAPRDRTVELHVPNPVDPRPHHDDGVLDSAAALRDVRRSVPGFPFLASIIAIFSGAQLFALGIMGEYLARVHVRVMERPAYAVGATVGTASGPAAGPDTVPGS